MNTRVGNAFTLLSIPSHAWRFLVPVYGVIIPHLVAGEKFPFAFDSCSSTSYRTSIYCTSHLISKAAAFRFATHHDDVVCCLYQIFQVMLPSFVRWARVEQVSRMMAPYHGCNLFNYSSSSCVRGKLSRNISRVRTPCSPRHHLGLKIRYV